MTILKNPRIDPDKEPELYWYWQEWEAKQERVRVVSNMARERQRVLNEHKKKKQRRFRKIDLG